MSLTVQPLGEIAQQAGGVVQTGPFGSQLHSSDYRDDGTPVVMPQDIVDDRISVAYIARVDDATTNRLARHRLAPGDLVIPRRGDLGKRALITQEHAGWLCGTGSLKISIAGGPVLPDYLFYYLKQGHVTQQIEGKAVGSTMLNLSATALASLEIAYPPLPTQRRIAAILAAYDDLIENNCRRMALLEDAMHLLYREWFVHLRFPGYERTKIVDAVPVGWCKRRLEEVGFLNYGKSLTETARQPGDIPVYGSSGIVGTHVNALIDGPTIIVGRKGNVGSLYWSLRPCYPIDTVFYIDCQQSSLYLYYNLQYQHFINNDAAVPGLNRAYAHSLPILWPDEATMFDFETHAQTVHRQIETLAMQNERLREARDLLLPRLMNGTIPV